jgi:hypothetical protein
MTYNKTAPWIETHDRLNYGFVYSIFFSFLHTNGKTAVDWTQKANIGKLAFLIR